MLLVVAERYARKSGFTRANHVPSGSNEMH